MSDNVNIIVQDTINEIVVNSAVIVETIDINVQVAVDEVTIIANPNEYIINVNRIIGEQVQSDWNETDDQAPDYIKNKPTIPAAQVNSDWDATSGVAEILNKPTIPAAVTKTSDLINDGEDGVNPFITLEDIPVVEGFVPYTGATQDVNLGEFGIQLGNLEFDTTPTNAPTGVGSLVWNDTAGTLDLKLKGNAVTLQIGQETVARVVNKTATNVTLLESKYQIVRVTGAQGQRPKVDLALANNDLNSTTTLGLVTENILNNQEGFITTSGQVQQINTTGSLQGETWADGDVLYLSGTVAGQATNIKPIAPIHTVIVGFVEYAHITQGKIFVKVDNGYELEELHNVSAIAPNNNEVLTYDSATLLWKPKTVFQLPSLTSGSVLFSNGTTIAQKNSNFFWDNINNRLGIGTNAPTVGLETKGGFNLYTSLGSHYLTSTSVSVTDATLKFTRGAENGWVRFQLGFFQIASDSVNGECRWNAPSGGFFSTFYSNGIERMRITTTGNTLINTTTDNGGKLQIKAGGALSTDIALRVRNSADTEDLMTVNGLGVNTVGRLVTNGTLISTSITNYLNTIGGTQTVDASLAAFSSTAHTYFSPTITSNLATARPIAVAIVPTTSGTLNSKTVLYLSNSNLAPSTGGVNGTININENTTSGYGILIGMGNGSSSVGLYINAAKKAIDIAGPVSGGSGIAINRSSSTLVQYNPITTYEAFAGILSPSILEYRNTTTGNSTEITALDIINSSANSAGVLGNNAGINLRFGMNTSLGVTNYAKIAAICPNQTTSPSVIDLGFYVSNSSGTSTNALYISGQTQSIGVGTIVPVASAKIQIDSTTQGFLPPRMTNAQRIAIATPAVGLCVYCTDVVEGLYINKSTGWTYIG